MSPREQLVALRLDAQTREQLEAIRQQYGTPVSEQIRRAIHAWLEAGGMEAEVRKVDAARAPAPAPKTARKRGATRKRA